MSHFSPTDIRMGLSGPVFPVITPFHADGAVDYVGLQNYVEFLISAGAKTILTTVGTSRFNLLSDQEILEVNKIFSSISSPDTIKIAAGPMTGNLKSNIDFAVNAEANGADAFIAYFPERWYGPDAIYEFFKAISEAVSIAILIHEMPMRSGYGGQQQYPIDLLGRLISLPNLVGMKEECMDGGYAYQIHRRLEGKCAIIGAGAMRNFMRDFHAGAKANLVGVGSFFPKVEIAFQEALINGNLDKAHKIVREYEDPYFDVAVKLGWHPQLKETLHLMGLIQPYERAPLPRLDNQQREILKTCIMKLGWLDLAPDHVPCTDS